MKWNTLSISLNSASWSMQPEGTFVLAFWHPALHRWTNLTQQSPGTATQGTTYPAPLLGELHLGHGFEASLLGTDIALPAALSPWHLCLLTTTPLRFTVKRCWLPAVSLSNKQRSLFSELLFGPVSSHSAFPPPPPHPCCWGLCCYHPAARLMPPPSGDLHSVPYLRENHAGRVEQGVFSSLATCHPSPGICLSSVSEMGLVWWERLSRHLRGWVSASLGQILPYE